MADDVSFRVTEDFHSMDCRMFSGRFVEGVPLRAVLNLPNDHVVVCTALFYGPIYECVTGFIYGGN